MQAQLEGVERRLTSNRDRELAVDDELIDREAAEKIDHLWKVSAEIPPGLRCKRHLVGALEREASEAVPFRLVLPRSILRRKERMRARLHGREIEREWEIGQGCPHRSAS